jgi:outer membrane protein assembly factor BamB
MIATTASRVTSLFLGLSLAAGVGCVYRSSPETGLCRDRTLDSKPFRGSRIFSGDIENLVYVNEEETLWISDDNADQIYQVDRNSGDFKARLRARDMVAAFPDAGRCEDGDDDPETECSYVEELETLAYDGQARTLYIINTVGDPERTPPKDKPAIFRLRKREADQNFRFRNWQELPNGPRYDAAVVADGTLYVAVDAELRAYTWSDNTLDGTAALSTPHGNIVGAGYDGEHVWLLTVSRKLVRIRWSDRSEDGVWDLESQSIGKAKGLAVAPGEVFVADGDQPNPIYALRFDTTQGMGRPAWLGGWPRSCP